ncbi:hypothetical protein CsSME_00045057 [Camellia sinensis var. sinensis]
MELQDVQCGVTRKYCSLIFQAQQSLWKCDSMGKLSTNNKVKVHKQARSVLEEDANVTSRRVLGLMWLLEMLQENQATCVASTAAAGLPCEDWKKDEQRLKREKRKHANRQFGRRSSFHICNSASQLNLLLELMKRYETVKVENITLKSEMKQLMEGSEKLRVENVALMGLCLRQFSHTCVSETLTKGVMSCLPGGCLKAPNSLV